MLKQTGITEVSLNKEAILNQVPRSVLAVGDKANPPLLQRPPIIEIDRNRQLFIVHVLPWEANLTELECLRCLDIGGVSAAEKGTVIEIVIACLRANYDLSAGDAISEIASAAGRLNLLSKPFWGTATYSTPAHLRRLVGEASLSQDTAARCVKAKIQNHVDIDKLVRAWSPEISASFGNGPYVVWPLLIDRLMADCGSSDEMRVKLERAAKFVISQDIANVEKVATYLLKAKMVV